MDTRVRQQYYWELFWAYSIAAFVAIMAFTGCAKKQSPSQASGKTSKIRPSFPAANSRNRLGFTEVDNSPFYKVRGRYRIVESIYSSENSFKDIQKPTSESLAPILEISVSPSSNGKTTTSFRFLDEKNLVTADFGYLRNTNEDVKNSVTFSETATEIKGTKREMRFGPVTETFTFTLTPNAAGENILIWEQDSKITQKNNYRIPVGATSVEKRIIRLKKISE